MDKWVINKGNKSNVEKQPVASTSTSSEVSTEFFQLNKPKRPSSDKKANEKRIKKRKYDESYLQFGFTWTGNFNEPNPQCVICNEVLSQNSMKPSLLKRHFETKHAVLKDKPLSYFERSLEDLKTRKTAIRQFSGVEENENALKASYKVSLQIAKAGKNHTIGESLIIPAAEEIAFCMFGEKEANLVKTIPLSNDTVSRRITDMAGNVKDQLIQIIQCSPFFAIQVDETTDVAGLSQLLVFVRGKFQDAIFEDILFCKPLETSTTGKDIFNMIDNFFSENNLEWKNCISVCTDGAKAMSGHTKGLLGLVKEVTPECKFTHCCLHREALIAKFLPDDLQNVLNESVKIVNFIKTRPLKSRVFSLLCEEMGSLHKKLLLHTEVRWLSGGNVLRRLFELHNELRIFFMDHKFDLSAKLYDLKWLLQLAYLADIFEKMNVWNLSLQGDNVDVFFVEKKTDAMLKKISLWENQVKNNSIEQFERLESLLNDNEKSIADFEEIKLQIIIHLSTLQTLIRQYFPPPDETKEWIRDPFTVDLEKCNLPLANKEELIEISCEKNLKSLYGQKALITFWIAVEKEYPVLSSMAVQYLLPFTTTYLCEKGFSSLTVLKTKFRNRLDVEDDLRLYLSKLTPDIQEICKGKQAHPSH